MILINTENEIIISGNKINCNKVVTELNCNAVKVPFQNIIHHDFCKTAYDELIEMHNFPIEECPNIDFYSSIGLKKLPFESKTIAENSTEVCFKPVNFPRTCEYIYQEGARIFIELGANATCSNWISTNLKDKEHVAISMNKKGKTDSQSLVEVMAQLLSHGVDMDLKILYKNIKDQKHNRTFLKKIIPGGNRIFDVIVNNKNKEKFTPKSKVCSTKTLKPVLAMEEKYFVKSDEILDTEKQLAHLARMRKLAAQKRAAVALEKKRKKEEAEKILKELNVKGNYNRIKHLYSAYSLKRISKLKIDISYSNVFNELSEKFKFLFLAPAKHVCARHILRMRKGKAKPPPLPPKRPHQMQWLVYYKI